MVIRQNKQDKTKYDVDISRGTHSITGERLRTVKKGISSLKEAKRIEQELNNLSLNYFEQLKVQTDFESLATQHFLKAEQEKKPTYIQSMKANYSKHLLPYFQHATLRELNERHILEFREHLQQQSQLNPSTINKILLLLKQILNVGVANNIILSNPCLHLKNLPTTQKKMEFYTANEFKLFIEPMKKNDTFTYQCYTTLFYLLFLTGLRIGEALALTWDDIQLHKQELSVTKTVSHLKGKTYVTPPKSKNSIRHVTLNTTLINILSDWKKLQEKQISTSHHIFQIGDSPLTRFHVRKFLDGFYHKHPHLKKIRLHDFRHSHVALLISQSEDLVIIKERLGHSTINITIDNYGHLYPNRQKNSSDKFEQLDIF